MSIPDQGADLTLDRVRAGYGRTVVLDGVSLSLRSGATLAVLGRNGVGKTTLLSTIMGHTTLHGGTIRFRGQDITALPAYGRCRGGIGFVPQEREIFPSLTLEENLTVAARPGRWTVPRVYDFFPRLAERRRNRGNQLSGGEQQMLAIGRALLTNPKLLIMDEPSEGLAPAIVEQLTETCRTLVAEGVPLLLIEQNLGMATAVADRLLVMVHGEVALETTSAELLADEDAQRRYLGVEPTAA